MLTVTPRIAPITANDISTDITIDNKRLETFRSFKYLGGRRRGRQRKRWEDNIKEWTGLEWNILLRKAENREEWRKLVVKSAVVPQRSARPRDR